jgi:anti-sigma regulatory factor (Ser/Thr protein kinase)
LCLLCPYDVDALDPAVIEEARRSHPMLVDASGRRASTSFRDTEGLATAPFSAPLAEPDRPRELVFQMGSLAPVRSFVSDEARSVGLKPVRVNQLVLAVNEVATNTLRHAGGIGRLRVWRDEGVLICEVRDSGRLDQPMVGREHPTSDQESGRGLWMANQLCDLVQIRSLSSGTVVRLHCRC